MDSSWIPSPLASLLNVLWKGLSKPRRKNLMTVLLGILLTSGRPHLTGITGATRRKKGSRTNLGRFLALSSLDTAYLLKHLSTEVLCRVLPLLRQVKNRRLYLILDSTIRGRASLNVPGSQLVKLPKGGFGPGQILMVAAVKIGPFVLPIYVEPVLNKRWAKALKRPRRTQIRIAEDIIRSYQPPAGWDVMVLFDSFFGANQVLKACEERGFTFVTNLKANRKVRAHRPLRQVGGYAANVLSHTHEGVKIGTQRFSAAVRDSAIPGFGRIRLVFSRKPGHRRIFHLATNATNASIHEIIGWYLNRWPIECLFKDVKHHLGLGQYPARTLEGAINHDRLTMMAHLLLTFLRAKRMDTGKIEMKSAPSPAEIRSDLRTRFHANRIYRTVRRKRMPANIDQIMELLRSTG